MPTLVAIQPPVFDVELDIAYATERNFTGKPVYNYPYHHLHPQAAECLTQAITLAKRQGYRIKIFDAFRPHAAQWVLWNHTPDPEFISHPETGSLPHCRGVAVDLTLLDSNGNELDMGTPFDSFTPLSHHGSTGISPAAERNRFLLMGIMITAGWDFYRNEWWHYQLFNARSYPIVTEAEIKALSLTLL